MSEINTDLRDDFLGKHADACTPAELFANFNHYFEKFRAGDCVQNSASLHDAVIYLVRLLNEYPPEVSMRVTLDDSSGIEYNAAYIEEKYTEHLLYLAMIKEYYGDKVAAACSAKKALDMVNYFHPNLNDLSKQKIVQEGAFYRMASEIFNLHKQDWEDYLGDSSEENIYERFTLNWEKKIYKPDVPANQNFQYRIFD